MFRDRMSQRISVLDGIRYLLCVGRIVLNPVFFDIK
ncbi:hypothetical protein EVA_20988 [gut metagenome]|uniref:Uncharacterized protein n=1 Tax=gut metagenome TaxID=749906 RepID=J9FU49_9ZZZZ